MKKWKQNFKQGGLLYTKWYYTLAMIITASLIIGYMFALYLHADTSLWTIFSHSIISTAFIWGGCLLIVTYTWKKFPWERMPLKHLLIEFVGITLYLIIFSCIVYARVAYQKGISFEQEIRSNMGQIVITFLISYLITSIHEAVFFFRQWKVNFSKSIKLERDNIEARYNALKAQINPHFLFNSLNSLMTLVEDNPKAERYVQDLSEFLRYVLLSNERETVSLQEELDYLEKYIYLQKMRFGENLQVAIRINNEAYKQLIPPLVLQMLFDNCIKHNVITQQKPLTVEIIGNEQQITVVNNLQKKRTAESTGQGLKNIAGRFRILSGIPIKINSTDTHFSVTIPLINTSV